MAARSETPTAPQPYFYIIQSETGESIVEYGSTSAPPKQGTILNLINITRNYDHVVVIKVEQMRTKDHEIVKVTVKPTNRRPDVHLMSSG